MKGILIIQSLKTDHRSYDRNSRLQIWNSGEIELLEDDKKKTLFDVIDTFIRESKGRKAFAI